QDIIKIALNANLPDDIRIMDACEERESFHPRYDAKTKTYFYVIANSRVVSPFLYKYACRVPHELSFGAMSHALSLLKGRHDFSSFRGSGCGAKNPVRTVFDISIEKLDSLSFMTAGLQGNFLKLRIKGDAFLRHMVRNIVGTVIEAGRGKINASDMEKILLSKDRRLAGPTAPARGLFLENIDY
ncbi:MAG: tRNA pseudouridine synthase A, partial [Nitrospirae bacterium]|nr:tRNA pseudouridine synthase A [Nitrospirota bacterium]